MDRASSTHGVEEECIEGFGGKAKRKDTLGTHRRKGEDNIKMDLRKREFGAMDWIIVG
jgi:hypothetical protein